MARNETAAATTGPFRLTSAAFDDNGLMARTYAGRMPNNPNGVGDNVSPPLTWANPPAGTRSFAIVMHDQEGRKGLGVVHWVAYGIAASVVSLPEGAGDGAAKPESAGDGAAKIYVGGSNVLGNGAYLGPCPPKTDAPHHYVFTIIATDLAPGALRPGLTMPQLLDAIGTHALGATSLVARFGHQDVR